MQNKKGMTRRETLVASLGGLFALTSSGVNAAGEAQLTFWTVRLNTPELAAGLKGILDAFMKENPGIKITNEPVSGTLVYPKFQAAIQGQQMPDIAEAYSYHPLQFAALGQMAEMDDIIKLWEGNGLLKDIVNEFAYKKFHWKDHYWGVPYNLDIRAIYYRKDILAAKGIKPPTNWDEFQKAVVATNDPGNGMYGLAFPAGDFHIAQHYYMSFMFQAGGSLLDKDGKLVFGTTAKDANVKALTYLTDFATKYKATPPGIAAWNTDDPHTFYMQGRSAFVFGTGGLIGRIMNETPDMYEKTGILEVLEGPAGKAWKLSAGFYNPMFVWKYSPNLEAAKTFVKWFVQPGRLDVVLKAKPGQLWPIFKQEINSDRVKTNRLLKEALTNVVPFATDFAYPGTGIPEMGVIDGEKMFAAPVNQVVSGTKTPEQAVLEAHAKMKKVFES